MHLGPIEIPTDLVLAPLMDVTTPSLRQLIYDLGGVGLMVTPMLFVQQFVAAPKTIVPHLEHLETQRPAAIQLVTNGKNPEAIRETLDYLSTYKFDVIDINAGCPAPHTMRSGGGGSFLKDLHLTQKTERLERVVKTTLKYSPVPVSLKTRLGFERKTDVLKILPFINQAGLAFLTLHGRTVKQKYSGTANYEVLRTVKEKLKIPLIANGDVSNYSTYKKIKEETNCEVIMIGRAAMFNPSVFTQIQSMKKKANSKYLESENSEAYQEEEKPKAMSLAQIRQYLFKIEKYIQNSSKFWNNDRFKLAEFRRLAIWWIKGIPGYKHVRMVLSKIHDFQRLRSYIFGEEIEKDFSKFLTFT
ncbi:MAG: tRNA dihydrouridine synthase [Promethearchaeota archaeon]